MPPHIISAFSSSLNLLLLFVNLPCFIFLNLAPEMVKFRRKFLFIVKFNNSVIIRPYYHVPLGHRKDINYKNASFLVAQI